MAIVTRSLTSLGMALVLTLSLVSCFLLFPLYIPLRIAKVR